MFRIFKTSLPTILAVVLVLHFVCRAESLPPLTRHVREVTLSGAAPFAGQLPATEVMRLVLVLPIRDQAGLDDFLKELYDSASPSYRNFLTVEEFTARFGPTQQDYAEVMRFALANGFTVVGTSRNRLNLDVTGTVAAIEAAFHINLSLYRDPTTNRTFYAPDREPTPDLPFALWHIAGLDNYSIPQPALHRVAPGAKPNATTGSGPSSSFLGSDMRAAYYGGTLTGTGQSLGLLEYYGTDLADLTKYYSNAGQTNNVKVTVLSTDGSATSCLESGGCDDTEQTLDMTQALGMAPGMSSLVMYVGKTDSAIFNAMATASPLNAQLSSSWTWSPADTGTDNPYFAEFAAQGQNLFQAAGDSGAWKTSSAAWPADSVYLTSVGGTDLTTSSAGGPWRSETAWVDGGGGISPNKFTIPSWQTAAASGCSSCSKSYRNAPDVSANANNTFYVCADQTTCTANDYGGTSFAAPMWAGYLALVNQQAVANTGKTVGFINPTLYTLGLGSTYTTDFHDITSGSNGDSATTGYDLATGWGSPNGPALIDALAGSSSGSFSLSASPTSVSVVQGNSGTSTITSTLTGTFDAAVSLSANGQPSGVTASFSPASIAAPGSGSSTLTLAAGSSAATGTYTVTITGTGGGLTETATVSLTVTASPSFKLTANPASVSVQQGAGGTSTITSTVAGGFSSAVALSASGMPSGVTASFSPASIASPGSGTSTLTLTVGSSAATGTYPVTVTGAGGGLTETTSVSLTVTSASTPSFTLTASPASVTVQQGTGGTSTISSSISGGFDSAIALSASGLPSGVTASFSPASIAAPGSGSSTLTLSASSSAAAGTYTITIGGAGGGVTASTSVSLTVTSASMPSFTLTASPSSVTVQQGSNGTSTITSAISGGFSSAIALSASGAPSGVTASFSPASIAAPGSGTSTLTLTAGSSAAAGAYSITVTGNGGGLTATTSVSLTVASSTGSNLVQNGGFETGAFTGWKAAGPVKPTVSSTHAHSGGYSALVGQTTTPEVDGNSSLYQSVTIPSTANAATLTFWYWPSTDDTITYAYQEALIKNSSGKKLATVLKAASNARAWTQVTYDLTKYKGQTIRVFFAVHGNGYAKDYVYMYVDDVSVTVQ